jgi:hypothetical protein
MIAVMRYQRDCGYGQRKAIVVILAKRRFWKSSANPSDRKLIFCGGLRIQRTNLIREGTKAMLKSRGACPLAVATIAARTKKM